MAKETKKMDIRFVKMSKQYSTPNIEIEKTDQYVKFGKDNTYPYYLLEQFRLSGLHRAIIERKVNMMIGNGLRSGEKDMMKEQANRFETFEEVLTKCAYDLELFGGYYIEFVYSKKGDRVAEFYHSPYQNNRVGLPNQYGFITTYFSWKKIDEKITSTTRASEFKKIQAFNKFADKKKSQMMFIKGYNPSSRYYSGAVYEGSLIDIQTYGEISNYHNSNLHNNFSAGYSIFFRGQEPTPEQKDEIITTIKGKYSGTENTGKPMVFFLDTDQEKPEVIPLDSSDNSDQFDSLLESIRDNIAISHQIPRQIVGLASAGSLGQSKEILESSQMFRTDYIEPRQTLLLKGFNNIMELMGFDDMEIDNPNPNALMFGITELIQILTTNEIRNLIGFKQLEEDGDEVIGLKNSNEMIEPEVVKPNATLDNGKPVSKKNDNNRKSKL